MYYLKRKKIGNRVAGVTPRVTRFFITALKSCKSCKRVGGRFVCRALGEIFRGRSLNFLRRRTERQPTLKLISVLLHQWEIYNASHCEDAPIRSNTAGIAVFAKGHTRWIIAHSYLLSFFQFLKVNRVERVRSSNWFASQCKPAN